MNIVPGHNHHGCSTDTREGAEVQARRLNTMTNASLPAVSPAAGGRRLESQPT